MGHERITRLEHHTAPALHELAPPASLSSFIERFWRASVPENGRFREFVIIPDGCVDVVYEHTESHMRCLIFGTYTETRPFRITPEATYVGIRFRPGMARHLLDVPLEELRDRHVEVPGFLGLTPEQIAEAPTFSAQGGLLARTLIGALRRRDVVPTSLDRAIGHVQHHRDTWRVESLAAMSGFSARQLERTVKATVGLPPKLLMRILRVQAAITVMQCGPQSPLVDLAAALGYSDQAHMNRDFRLLTGSTPSHYRAALAKKT